VTCVLGPPSGPVKRLSRGIARRPGGKEKSGPKPALPMIAIRVDQNDRPRPKDQVESELSPSP